MLNTARQRLLRLVALVALALVAPAMAEDCHKGKCFGVNWERATPEEIANIDVNAKDKHGNTPLHAAARRGNNNPDVINALIEKGANVNAKNEYGATPLLLAAENVQIKNAQNAARMDALIQGGADVNAKNKDGKTPLHLAINKSQSPEAINALVKGGADVNAKNKDGYTPLHFASLKQKKFDPFGGSIFDGVFGGKNSLIGGIFGGILGDGKEHIKIKNLSLETMSIRSGSSGSGGQLKGTADGIGFDINFDSDGSNGYVRGFVGGKKPVRFDINYDRNGSSGYAIGLVDDRGGDTNATLVWHNKMPEIINALVENGADVNAKKDSGWMSWSGAKAKIMALMGKTTDNDSGTPLHFAAKYNDNPKIISALVENGADVNAQDDDGNTPLHLAEKHNKNREVINALVKGGADASIKNDEDKTPRELGKES